MHGLREYWQPGLRRVDDLTHRGSTLIKHLTLLFAQMLSKGGN